MPEMPTTMKSTIDWAQVEDSLPKTTAGLLKDIKQSYDAGGEDPARAVELMLRGKVAKLNLKYEQLRKDGGK
jgi:hypothetical protein